MSKKAWGGADKDDSSPVAELYRSSAVALSNLQHYLLGRADEVRFLRLTPKGESEWLAILAIFGDDGTPMVAFGSGETWIDALRQLNATISTGNWKVDKFAR